MAKFFHNKRVFYSVYSKRLKFHGKELQERPYSSEAWPCRRLQNRYSYKDFTKFTGKRLYQILYLMKLQASSLHLYCKRGLCSDVFLRICGIFKNVFLIELFRVPGDYFWLFKYVIVDKNVSRYCNKDIKVLSVQARFATLCQFWKWFYMLRKLWKPLFKKTCQNLKNLQGKCLWRSFPIVKPFFCGSQ